MNIRIITTQPQIYQSFLETGLIARGLGKKIINIELFNLHDFAFDTRGTIDDTPYGGGAGMVLKVDVLSNAIKKLKTKNTKVVLLSPQGKKFNQKEAKRLAKEKDLILIAGRFEGYDERILNYIDEEISIGDYVLTNGDLPAMTVIDAIARQVPGFIDRKESIEEESFEQNLLEYPQYTRPETFEGISVPEILLSGNHAEIAKWRKEKSIEKTKEKRPDLL